MTPDILDSQLEPTFVCLYNSGIKNSVRVNRVKLNHAPGDIESPKGPASTNKNPKRPHDG
jgi:hypothetical protein